MAYFSRHGNKQGLGMKPSGRVLAQHTKGPWLQLPVTPLKGQNP